tara:strand:+ start:281 stop:670 length:390 start_codon:yes stop_codon:yes gene_type:complete
MGFGTRPFLNLLLLIDIASVGVPISDPEDPFPAVGGTETRCFNTKAPNGVVFAVQVFEYGIQTESKMSAHVLSNRVTWTQFSNEPKIFWPEVSFIRFAFLMSGNGKRLTRVASADDIDSSFAGNNSVCL